MNVILAFISDFGAILIFLKKILRQTFQSQSFYTPVLSHIASVSYRSLPTIAFSGIFVGAILVLQFNQILEKYDAQVLLGGLNTSAIIREVGPLIISFLLAGKVGAYTAAELGTMRVTEQIEAIECLGTNSIEYLILPRFYGILISSLLLLGISLMISIAGAMAVAHFFCGINFLQFASSVPRFTGPWTIFSGIFKSFLYGGIVASVSCYQGYHASGGARGVGKAVTLAALYTNFYIVIANFVSSRFLDFIYQFLAAFTGDIF